MNTANERQALVFCKRCLYYRDGGWDICDNVAFETIEITPLKPTKHIPSCSELNANNDCCYFLPGKKRTKSKRETRAEKRYMHCLD